MNTTTLPSLRLSLLEPVTVKHVPERYTSSLNKKLELKNAVIDWLVKNQVGLPNVQTLGISFVNTLTQVMWDLDGHHEMLARCSFGSPAELAHLSGFNVPEKHKHKLPGNLTQNMVSEQNTALLNLMQLAYMKTDSWKEVYAVPVMSGCESLRLF